MLVTRFAQSTFTFRTGSDTILIDPGVYNFTDGRITRDTLPECSLLILTHKHSDHYDLEAVQAVIRGSNPRIIACPEVCGLLATAGIAAERFTVGSSLVTQGFSVKGYRADHVVNGEEIDIFGVLVEAEGKTVYHCSDTTYFEPDFGPVDLVIVPINNRGVSMNFEEAKQFSLKLNARMAIPVHYDSPKDAHIDPNSWVELLEGTEVLGLVLGFQHSVRI